jgi:filamentous hemagglutinin family protein
MCTTKSLPILLSNTLILSCHLASAEIITDGSLGAATRLSAPNYIINDSLGTQKGNNLFHSFQTFNVGTGETATFISPPAVQNILARITGGDRSSIDGTINAQANLYLLNPYGFLFDKHAQLNINGAFYASTARGIPLGAEGDAFMASLQANTVLSVAPPMAFGFLDSPPARTEIQGETLTLTRQNFYAPRGNILIHANQALAIRDSTLFAPEGRIQITTPGQMTLSQSSTQERIDNSLLPANLDVSSRKDWRGPGGKIFIQAADLVLDKAEIFADSYGGDGMGIEIKVDGQLHLNNGARITADNYGNGRGGTIKIGASSLFLTGQNSEVPDYDSLDSLSTIATNNIPPSNGVGGDIDIQVSRLELAPGLIQSATNTTGNAGSISIDANHVQLDTGFINAITNSSGQGGHIKINAANDLFLKHGSGIATGTVAEGNGGDIELTSSQMLLSNQSTIDSFSGGIGRAGTINLTAANVKVENSGITTEALQASGGDINLQVTERLDLTNHGRLTAEAYGQQRLDHGGNITLTQPTFTIFQNSQVFTKGYAGDGGNINLHTDYLIRDNKSELNASSKLGIDGEIVIDARDTDLSDLLVTLPQDFGDVSTLLPCPSAKDPSSLRVAGKLPTTKVEDILARFREATYIPEGTAAQRALLHQNVLSSKTILPLENPLTFAQLAWQRAKLRAQLGSLEPARQDYQSTVQALQFLSAALHLAQVPPKQLHLLSQQVFKPLVREWIDLLLQQQHLSEALDLIELLKGEEIRDYFNDACLPAKTNLKDIDRQHTAIIYPLFLPKRVVLLLQLPQQDAPLVFQVTASPQQVTDTVKQLRTLLACQYDTEPEIERCAYSSAYQAPARQLYDWLIRPLTASLTQIETLVFVPDETLYTIPFGVLYDGHQFLLDKYALAVAPALTLLTSQPHSASPVTVLYGGLSESKLTLPPLQPYATTVSEEIEKHFATHTLLGTHFVVAEMTHAFHTGSYSIVHIFSHAQFAGDVDQTYIATYNDKLDIPKLESMITPSPFHQVPLELLVLGACETAKGDDRAALGLAGIAFKAGARSAMGSLWKTRSDVVGFLSGSLYAKLKAGNLSKAQALREVQLEIKRRPFPPYFWSPFLLIGNWLP